MTRLRIEVGAIVVRGLPASRVSADLGLAVEDRLAQLARGENPPHEPDLADQVAQGIWAEVRRSAPGLGERS